MNEKSIFEAQEKQIENLGAQVQVSDSLRLVAENEAINANYFNLMGNSDAMTYLENLGMEAADVKQQVGDAIIEKNLNPDGNPLVPMNAGSAMRINKIKFLNHRWVIANFSDGNLWGEVLIEYFYDENNELFLKPISSLVYPES